MPTPSPSRKREGGPHAFRWAAVGIACLLLAAVAVRFLVPSPLLGTDPLDLAARRYVALALTLGRIESREVDGYFGPAALKPSDHDKKPTLDALSGEVHQLAEEVAAIDDASPRHRTLADRIDHLQTLVDIVRAPHAMSFAEEAQTLYDLPPQPIDDAGIARARAELDTLLPGPGPLAERVEAYRARFLIPEDRRQALFARALGECRRRTLAHWRLPADEKLDVAWTRSVDSPWHRYLGNHHSLLQVNPGSVALLNSAVDVACHEGYPGHHAQFVLQDMAAGPAGLPIEDRVVLLRSPETMVREGAAEYGVDLVFPAADRLAFERDVLFPMAGLPRSEAERFEKVRALTAIVAPATAPIFAAYRDGSLTYDAASRALVRDALIASPKELLEFVDGLGPYALGYTVSRDRVRDAVAGGGPDRWATLGRLVAAPRFPPPARTHP